MDIESLDVNEDTGGSSSVGDELGNNGEWEVGVDELAWAIEVKVAHSVGVDITSIGIALGSVSVSNTAAGTSALVETVGAVARVTRNLVSISIESFSCWANIRSICVSERVGLPDIHLVTASTIGTDTRVGTVGCWNPSLDVCLQNLSVDWSMLRRYKKLTAPLMNLRSRGH